MSDRIPAWSFSRLSVYEKCPKWAKLAYKDRIPEPPRPLPPGKTEHANERGQRVHTAAELYVQGDTELIPELSSFRDEFVELRSLYGQGKVSLEGEWAFNKDWSPVDWRSYDAWLRLKLDALVFLNDYEAVVIDHKTGKKSGNEIKHQDQCQLYQLSTFLRYPKLEKITVELWYPDQNDVTQVTYTKEQGLKYFTRFHERGMAMTTETKFPAKPNKFTCKWCPYGPKGTGHCKEGIQ